ncbi:MAG: EamA family transporter [Lachnospiraceae bacterium]|nr:EamA family transporter [Lachnospiraceae bacterium]MBQ2406073.1 EamA family transporter [Lachnospiraceae bacterium]MEE0918669.1 EamA family transporter [Lachnospiraceae bacterium]
MKKDLLKKIKNIVMLQAVIIIYTFSSIMSKKASQQGSDMIKALFFFGMTFVILGIYAICWQQMIKKFELSIAYANRSMAIFWSMIWARLFFNDQITFKNIVGVIIVFVGTLIINFDTSKSEK